MEYEFSKISAKLLNLESGYVLEKGEKFLPWKANYFEAVRVFYEESKISYGELLTIFWKNIDPSDDTGQFLDRGPQYRTAIFYTNCEQKTLAMKSREIVEKSGIFDMVATLILEAGEFLRAEPSQQRYYEKFPIDFRIHRRLSNRKEILQKWRNFKGFQESF